MIVINKPVRERDRNHLRFVASQPCLLCGRTPSDAHHIKYAEARAMGRKVSDKFTVPVCRLHHRKLHRRGDERAWWDDARDRSSRHWLQIFGAEPVQSRHHLIRLQSLSAPAIVTDRALFWLETPEVSK